MTTLLIVEDNELNRDMLSRRLKRRGFDVLLAVDGAEAVAVAEQARPDLILMDMSLPVLDGWEATRRIKASPASAGVPVIALTAHAMAGDEARAREAGCDDFDTKPVDLERLLGKIERCLTRDAGTAEITRTARLGELPALLEFVDRAAGQAGLGAEDAFAVRLAVEEVCTNVIRHGYAGGDPGPVRLSVDATPGRFAVTVEDRARLWDPAAAPVPELEAGWEERPLGGMGWHLVRRMMNEVHHEAVPGGGNRVTLVRHVPAGPAS